LDGGRGLSPLGRLALVVVAAATVSPLAAQVDADVDFDPGVPRPAFAAGAGPLLVVDEAHRNLHTASGRYAAFARVAEADGFRVAPGRAPFAADGLPADAILVIANAAGEAKPDDPALTADEIVALVAWVEAGGGLFLVADHQPFGTATAALTRAFGVVSHDGSVEDAAHQAADLPGPFFLIFSRENGLLGEHAIMEGRGRDERVERVATFGGQALEPGGARVLLRLGPDARIHSAPNTPEDRVEPTGGRAQMLALERGKGRVVIAGEAGMFAAQVIRGEAAARAGVPDPFRFGMTYPADNKQLLINTLRWLARSN
jgi:hypothetical protein